MFACLAPLANHAWLAWRSGEEHQSHASASYMLLLLFLLLLLSLWLFVGTFTGAQVSTAAVLVDHAIAAVFVLGARGRSAGWRRR